MTTVTFRPSIPEDLACFFDLPLPCRVKATTALIGDRVVGVAGLAFQADGTVAAFSSFTDALRANKVALYRAARRGLDEARRSGVTRIVSEAQGDISAAGPWLKHLGFEYQGQYLGRELYVWRTSASAKE